MEIYLQEVISHQTVKTEKAIPHHQHHEIEGAAVDPRGAVSEQEKRDAVDGQARQHVTPVC